MSDETANTAKNFAEQLDPADVQQVSSSGVSVTLRSNADKKAAIEAEILEETRKYNPLAAMFGASTWKNMRKA